MRTDNLFHEYFQLAPQALFELFGITPECTYQASSPVVKSSERRMDALLEPAFEGYRRYFPEVQGYRDELIYWRLVQEIATYHANSPTLVGRPWQAIALFLDAGYDPGLATLGPLGDSTETWLRRGVLTDMLEQLPNPSPVLNVLRPLVARSDAEVQAHGAEWLQAMRAESSLDAGIMARLEHLFVQFVIQRLVNLTREEIAAMLNLTPIEETVAGRQWIEEGELLAMRRDVRQVLEVRFGGAPAAIDAVIEQTTDVDRLNSLFRRALTAPTLAEVEQELRS